jgi:murein DD-endopeptidase MepM/ murein hydrolase activator NlpD
MDKKMRVQKKKKIIITKKKRFPIFLYVAIGIAVVCFVLVFFIFLNYKNSAPDSIYVFPENPKQGDTVFIRVKSDADYVTGNFEKERLVFYRKGNSSEWVSFLGIDADQDPGDFKIFVDTFKTEKLTKEIKVALADFSSEPTTEAPNLEQKGYTKEKAVNNIVKNDNVALKKFLSNFTAKPYFKNSFVFPLKKIERTGLSFGKFITFAKYKMQHLGVDLRASEKTNIYAINDGKVVATVNLSNYGKTVIIDHGLDIFSLYLHLDEFKVSEGQMVKRSQIIGLSGNSGYSTAPHLHFSMRVGGARVDPIVFIKTTKKIEDNFLLADISEAFLNILKQFEK